MISNWFGGNNQQPTAGKTAVGTTAIPALPVDVKEAVSKCRQATQNALQDRISRMDIEFPVGTKFNVEKDQTSKPKPKSAASETDSLPTLAELERSDRELARLFVDMFQPVGSDRITVAFTDATLAEGAQKRWKDDPTATCRVVSMDRRRSKSSPAIMGGKEPSSKRKRPAQGFAAKLAAEVDDGDEENNEATSSGTFRLPAQTEVAIFVAPGPKELVIIEKICQSVGMATLVILLNARLSKVTNFGSPAAKTLFSETFVSVFSLAAGPQEQAPGCLLYRAYPQPWVLARKSAVGPPRSILSQPNRPSPAECQSAFETMNVSDLEKGMENAMESVAKWFR